jgi:hypothetical protein
MMQGIRPDTKSVLQNVDEEERKLVALIVAIARTMRSRKLVALIVAIARRMRSTGK